MQPDPPRAELARQLLRSRTSGVLATNSQRRSGYPFASLVPYALDSTGAPLFLMSRLAVHTKNLTEDPRASLLVWAEGAPDAPLTSPRLTVSGEIRILPAAETERDIYVETHPDARQWIGFGDFALYRMEIQDAYYIAGFGAMGWISPADLTTRKG